MVTDPDGSPPEAFRSPLTMSPDATDSDVRSPLSAVVTVVVVVTLSLLSFVFAASTSRDEERIVEVQRTQDAVTAIDRRMSAYIDLLYGVRGVLGRESGIERADFAEYVRSLDVERRYPGVQVIGGAQSIERRGFDRALREISADAIASGLGYPTFNASAPTDEFALPIAFIEPVVGNERSFGFDLWDEPARQAAAERTRDTGRPAATAPLTLVQETSNQVGFLVMLPVYERDMPLDTIERRRAAFTGIAFAAFRMGDLMEGVIGVEDGRAVLEVYDHAERSSPAAEALTFRNGGGAPIAPTAHVGGPHFGSVNVAGRTWQIYYDSGVPALSATERSLPVLILVGGLFVAALLGLLVRSVQSARARAQRLATEMSGELKAITNATQEGIVSVDARGRIVSWNRGATQMFGYDVDQIMGSGMFDLMPVSRRDKYLGAFAELVRPTTGEQLPGGHVLNGTMEITGLHACGIEFPIEISVTSWESGGERYATGFMRDISDRRAAEERLTSTTELLAGVFSATTELAIIATDVDGIVVMFNAGAERMLQMSAAEVVGRLTPVDLHDWTEIEARSDSLGLEAGFQSLVAVARECGAETRRWTYVARDGRRLPVEVTATPMLGDDQAIDGFIFVGVDVTVRQAFEHSQREALAREREVVAKLRELDVAKSDFVSTMSHELRTPLTSIIGFTELLIDRDGTIDASELRMLETIERNAQRLLLLVEDLLTLSLIEAGGFELVHSPFDPVVVIDAAVSAIRPMAVSKQLDVRVMVDGPRRMMGDRVQFERVMLNLLSNAVKFTPAGGGVTVASSMLGDHAVVTVTDTGLGIPAGEIDRLFSRFFRSSTATEHAIQGTGLGLVIVQNIVEQHGGTISVESAEAVGTTFTVRLPIDPDRELVEASPHVGRHDPFISQEAPP